MAEKRSAPVWKNLAENKNILQTLFVVSVCLLGVAFGVNRHVHALVRVAGVLGAVLVFRARREIVWRDVPAGLWCALLFAVYVSLSPGAWFTDFRAGWQMLGMLAVGVAAGMLRRPLFPWFMRMLVTTLAVTFAVWVLFSPASFASEFGRIGLMHSPNVLGGMLAWCALYFLYGQEKKTARAWFFALCAVGGCVVLLFMTASRTAQLGFLAAMLFFLFRLPWKVVGVGLVVLAVCAVLGYAGLPALQQQRVRSLVTAPLEDATLKTRQVIWHVVRTGISRAPLLGQGASRFPGFYREYVSAHGPKLLAAYPQVQVESSVLHAHNLYLQLLFAYGVVGAALFAASVGHGAVLAWRGKDGFLLAVLLYFAVTGLCETSIQRTDGILMFFLPLGIAYGRALLLRGVVARSTGPADSAQPRGETETPLLPLVEKK